MWIEIDLINLPENISGERYKIHSTTRILVQNT